MLHVDPSSAATAATPAFCPIAYLAYCRACNVQVAVNRHNGEAQLLWDIGDMRRDPQLRHHRDPRLDIDADPDGRRKVYEVLCAEEWIAGARACGFLVMPWRLDADDPGGVLQMEGADRYAGCNARFLEHPAHRVTDDCREGVVFEVLCAEFDIDPDDPDLSERVNAKMRAACAADQVPA